MRTLYLFLVLIFFTLTANAQIQIWLNDGAIIHTANYRIDTANKTIFYLTKKNKTKYIEQKIVYAIIDKSDTIVINTPPEMSVKQGFEFLSGVHDGYHHKDYKVFIGNMLLGVASGYGLHKIGFSGIWTTIPNLTSSVIIGISDVKNRKLPQGSEMYRKGYKISAKKKKLILATEGSITGIVIGNLIGYITKNQ